MQLLADLNQIFMVNFKNWKKTKGEKIIYLEIHVHYRPQSTCM